jgi:hypothetical protein
MAPLRNPPQWWEWELQISEHVERRMVRREFNEVELRAMLEHARFIRPDRVEGRFVVEARHRRQPWIIIVEPEQDRTCILVVTAYPVTT